jgi:hypothetical protein
MNVLKHVLAPMVAVVAFTSACDTVDEADRLIYVKPVSVERHVLIEDFTGQRCVNCPLATEEATRLQEQYGEENVVVVGIHSGPFAKSVRGVPYSLYTADGDEYYDYWEVESQPKGVVNRTGTSDYTSWAALVRGQLSKTSPLALDVTGQYDKSSHMAHIKVDAWGTDGSTKGKLQLWLTEDSITAFQYMPDGSTNREYVHQHVLRCAVNGTWGSDFSVGEGDMKSVSFQQALEEGWVADNMAVVAFVYDDGGVCQVVRKRLEPLP